MTMQKHALLPLVGELNAAFSAHHIHSLVAQSANFAPGKALGPALAALVTKQGSAVRPIFETYIGRMPGGIQETLRGIIHYALSTTPLTLITFAWAPSYDYEVTLWQSVEPAPEQSGITVLLKSRYPDDKHPQS